MTCHAAPAFRIHGPDLRTLVLVGNPNVGKSVVFGALTGRYATVSNYPGTTVEVTSGSIQLGWGEARLIDTPGVYSLTPLSEDERVTRDILLNERADVVGFADHATAARRLFTSKTANKDQLRPFIACLCGKLFANLLAAELLLVDIEHDDIRPMNAG